MLVKKAPHSSLPYQLLLFLISPLLAFVNSVKHIHKREHFWIVLLFALFFSYTYIPWPESDAYRYKEKFETLNNYDFTKYINDVQSMYNGQGKDQDMYVSTIQLLVSPFTNDVRVYWLVLGFIYYYTFLSLIKKILITNIKRTIKFNWFIIGIVFIISFTGGINGVRWPLALMVFLLGSYQYITTSKIKFILLASLSPLIHFVFFYSVIFLFLYVLTKKYYNPKITSLLVLGGFFLSTFLVSGIKSNIGIIGESVSEKSSAYIENETWKEQRIEGFQSMNWYVKLQRSTPYYFAVLSLFITTYFSFNLKKSSITIALQYFTLLSFLASFLASQLLVDTDNRYTINAMALCFIYLYHLFNENPENRMLNVLNKIYMPLAILTVLVTMRADLYTVSPNLVFGNIFTEMFYRFDENIQELVGL